MKYSKPTLRNIVVGVIMIGLCAACDRDFATVESAIVNNDNATNFDTDSRNFDVIAYSRALPPVQTNDLPVNLLGVYNDPLYGRTTASLVTQLSASFLNVPDFGIDPVLDSVVITVPYFSRATNIVGGETIYELDSIFGDAPINLSLYESNYFLRDFEPGSDINDQQIYFSNRSTRTGTISNAQLEGTLIRNLSPFTPSNKQIILTNENGNVTQRATPALRVVFKPEDSDNGLTFWQNKILSATGQSTITNQSNLNDYFRGLYFKAEPVGSGDEGNLSIINFSTTNASIILYFKAKFPTANDPDPDPTPSTFTFGFAGNRVNFIDNNFMYTDGDPIQGDEKLFLKGGPGSMAIIELFDGEDVDDDFLFNSFEYFKNEFVEVDEDFNFVRSKKLINEANLVIYVDQESVENVVEPERIMIYDMDNNRPLIDYFFSSASTLTPLDSRTDHLGRLERDSDDSGVRYKIRLTEHINNLLLRDSTNVRLGITVSGNVDLESNTDNFDVLNPDDSNDKIPVSSIVTQRGTVLYGNNVVSEELEEKKLYLEIFFTEPNN